MLGLRLGTIVMLGDALGDVLGAAVRLGTGVSVGRGSSVGGGGLNMPDLPKSRPYTRISTKIDAIAPTQIFETRSSM